MNNFQSELSTLIQDWVKRGESPLLIVNGLTQARLEMTHNFPRFDSIGKLPRVIIKSDGLVCSNECDMANGKCRMSGSSYGTFEECPGPGTYLLVNEKTQVVISRDDASEFADELTAHLGIGNELSAKLLAGLGKQ
jgi:hypothetical protein